VKLERIAALLAKAERTDNAAEADAYLSKAQMLATLASIDLATARGHTQSKESSVPISRTVTIGEKGKRANTHLVNLFVTIAHTNSAQVDVARDSTYVISYGMAGDLDSIETLFASLAVQMTGHANVYVSAGKWRGESFDGRVRVNGRYRRRTVEFTAQTARAAFYRAYIARIGERLQEAREQAIRENDKASKDSSKISGSLVLADREKTIAAFHRSTSQARGRWGGYSGVASANAGSAGSAGRSAASKARLAEQAGIAGQRGQLPRG
jgi:hypothetical protein